MINLTYLWSGRPNLLIALITEYKGRDIYVRYQFAVIRRR